MNVLKKCIENKRARFALPLTPTTQQKHVMETDSELKAFYFQRQSGCTTAAFLKAFSMAASNDNATILIVNHSVIASKEAAYRFVWDFVTPQQRKNTTCNLHSLGGSVMFENGSKIMFVGGNHISALRGVRTPNCTIFDGAECYGNEQLQQLMQATSQSQILLLYQ